jgi:hypothetical protein
MAKQQPAKKTIGADPFLVQPLPDEDEPPPTRAASARRETAPSKPKPKVPKRQKSTVNVRIDLMDRVKNAAYWVPGLTVTSIVEMGLIYALEQVEKQHGGPFPAREAELVGGRPLGT